MATTEQTVPYGQPPLLQKFGALLSVLVHFPPVLAWTLATSSLHRTNKQKGWNRIISDTAFSHLTANLNIPQLQFMLGTSKTTYETWAKANKLPIIVDELGHDGRLFWIGERRSDKVILYFHGGGFLLPMSDFALSFWKNVKNELKAKDIDVGLAVLNYSLIPNATFPTQLHQAVLAVQFLVSSGVSPANIQFVGDSAGGNLIVQIFSHILHPVPSVPLLTLSAPILGAYLMSPWISLTSTSESMDANCDSDMIHAEGLRHFASLVLKGVPTEALPYLEPINAKEGWFDGLSDLVERILVTGGDRECLKDDIVRFGQGLVKTHKGARLVMQDYGVHIDPHLDFMFPVWEKVEGSGGKKVKVGAVTPLIIGWLADGWKK